MNCYAEDIADKEVFMKLLEMIDVFKQCYSKKGWTFYHEKVVELNIGMTSNRAAPNREEEEKKEGQQPPQQLMQREGPRNALGNGPEGPQNMKSKPRMLSPEQIQEASKKRTLEDEKRDIHAHIKKEGFVLSKHECRIWKLMETQKNGRISLEKEISSAVRMALGLKQICNTNLFFKDMRFGLDFESKSCFVEVRPQAYLMLYESIHGKLGIFNKKFRSIAKLRFKQWEQQLRTQYGQERVEELIKYSEAYFVKHPELFAWHQSRV